MPWAKCPRGQELRVLKGHPVGSRAASSRTPGDLQVTEHRALEMKVLVLAITCGLVAALQALDPPSLALEGPNVSLGGVGRAGVGRGARGARGGGGRGAVCHRRCHLGAEQEGSVPLTQVGSSPCSGAAVGSGLSLGY